MRVFGLLCLFSLFELCHLQTTAGPTTSRSGGVCSALWESDGDVTIGIVANFHTGSTVNGVDRPCWDFQPQYIELVEVVQWIFDNMNQNDYVPGVKIGVKVYDGCQRADVVSSSVVSMLPYLRYANISKPKTVDAIIGILTSSQAKHLADTLERSNVPLVSPTATAPSLAEEYSRFFRTIPNDVLQMKVLYNFIKSLQIKYFAIVSSDDDFGHQGTNEIQKLVKRDGDQICIARSIVMKQGFRDAIRIVDTLVDELQNNLNEKNLPVLFIGQHADAVNLVKSANTPEQARRLIWIFPDSIGVDASLFDGYERVGRNAFSVSPYYDVIDEFRSYWIRELYQILLGPRNSSNLLVKYVESLLGCSVSANSCSGKTLQDINDAYEQSSYINTVIHAAMALGKAFKTLHNDKCGSFSGLCGEFDRTLRSQTNDALVETIKSTSVRYSSMDQLSFVPQSLHRSNGIRFDGNGDLAVRTKQSIYIIHNAKCTKRCHFQVVGTATSDEINLEFDNITVYLNQYSDIPTTGSQLPSIHCEKNCSVCEDKFNPDVHHASIWGENLIVAFAPVHKQGASAFSCGDMRDRQTIEDVEALLYGVEKFNNNSGPWNNDSVPALSGHLGVIVFDSCQNSIRASTILVQWLSGSLVVHDRQGRYFDPKNCVGIIGGLYSQINLQILPITRREFLVQIGFASSSLELPLNSPEFLRTIPADDIQTQAMIDLVKKLGFDAFSVIYRDDAYGKNAYAQLKHRANEVKLCINIAIAVPRNMNQIQLADALATLQDAKETKVVLVFTNADTGKEMLKTANARTIRKTFTWIGSEAWGARDTLIDAESGNEALGMIVVDFPSMNNTDYGVYMRNLRPELNKRNMFFEEWWENKFQCQLPTTAIPNPPSKCSDTLSMESPSDTQTAMFALKALYTMALGLSSAFTKLCPMDPLNCKRRIRNENSRNVIASAIRTTPLLLNGKKTYIYTKRGDGRISEELLNVQKTSSQMEYVKIGEFTDGVLNLSSSNEVKFYDESGQETTKPSSTCFQCDCIYRNPGDPFIQLNNNITIEGQLYLAVFLPFHFDIDSSVMDPHTVLLSEVICVVLHNINTRIFKRNLLGLTIHDTYSDPNLASLQTSLVTKAGRYLRLKNYNVDNRDLIGVLTYGTGADSNAVNNALDPAIMHINVGTTVASQTMRKYFYNLGSTLTDELTALIAIVKHYNWNSMTIFYSNSEESTYVKDKFTQLSKKQGICAVNSIPVASIAGMRSTRNAAVIVLFLEISDMKVFLNTAGDKFENYQFIAWSKLTRSFPLFARNSNNNVLNNTLGVSLVSDSRTQSDILEHLRSKEIKTTYNPWMERNIELSKAFDNVSNIFSQMEVAVFSFAEALHSLMIAECGRNELCKELKSKLDWKNGRLSKFLEKERAFTEAIECQVMSEVHSYYTKSITDVELRGKKIGVINEGSKITMLDHSSNSHYEKVKVSCIGDGCDSCKELTTTSKFPGWTVSLIILIIIFGVIFIGVLIYLFQFRTIKQGRQSATNLDFDPYQDENIAYYASHSIGYDHAHEPGIAGLDSGNGNANSCVAGNANLHQDGNDPDIAKESAEDINSQILHSDTQHSAILRSPLEMRAMSLYQTTLGANIDGTANEQTKGDPNRTTNTLFKKTSDDDLNGNDESDISTSACSGPSDHVHSYPGHYQDHLPVHVWCQKPNGIMNDAESLRLPKRSSRLKFSDIIDSDEEGEGDEYPRKMSQSQTDLNYYARGNGTTESHESLNSHDDGPGQSDHSDSDNFTVQIPQQPLPSNKKENINNINHENDENPYSMSLSKKDLDSPISFNDRQVFNLEN